MFSGRRHVFDNGGMQQSVYVVGHDDFKIVNTGKCDGLLAQVVTSVPSLTGGSKNITGDFCC